MVLMDAFIAGDVYLDFPYESARFRYDKQTGKVFRHFYGKPEREIDPSSRLYHDAISSGTLITREEYFRGLLPAEDGPAAADVYLELDHGEARFRVEKRTGKVYERYRGQAEKEVQPDSGRYRDAVSAGISISRDEYFRD